MPHYSVEFLVVRELSIEADDELQAEREAYRQLNDGAAIAVAVRSADDFETESVLEYDDSGETAGKNWEVAKRTMHGLDHEFVGPV